jgi:hypothetical protein
MTRKLSQYKYESNSWKRVLDFIKQENVLTKNHLAEVITSNTAGNSFQGDIGYLLNDLLDINTELSHINKEVIAFDALLDNEIYRDANDKAITAARFAIIMDIKNLEIRFKNIKQQVDTVLSNTVLS